MRPRPGRLRGAGGRANPPDFPSSVARGDSFPPGGKPGGTASLPCMKGVNAFMTETVYLGRILTMAHPLWGEALLVRDGRIAAVGSREEVLAQTSPAARRIDLADSVLLPAFIDPHSHFSACANGLLQASLDEAASFSEVEETIRAYIERNRVPAGKWVLGKGYDHNRLAEQAHPTRELLDKAAPNNPVLLQHQSGHVGVANTAALELLGITPDTPSPEGGRIEVKDGRLTGYLEENAFIQALQKAPMPTPQELADAFDRAQTLYAGYGIATVQEGMFTRQLAPLYKGLLLGRLRLDLVGYADFADAGALKREFAAHVGRYHQRFKLGGYKIFLDGSPQGRTAWMLEEYPGSGGYRGYPTLPDETVRRALAASADEGMQLLAHCNGDAACAQYLAALETAAREGVDLAAMRPVMIHAQLLGRDQLPAVKRLGVIPSFFVAHVYHWGDIHWENLGPDRADRISPAGSAAELGIPFTFHTDAPVIPPDLLETVWCAANRVTRSGRLLGAEERVDVQTALEAVTANAAFQYFEERDKGTLSPGKRADLVILDRDPMAVPPEELRELRVLETWKDGVPIFCREA